MFRAYALIIFVSILIIISKKTGLKRVRKEILIITALPFGYIISGIVNNQNLVSMFIGSYNRNFGVLTYFALAGLVTLSAMNFTKSSSKYNNVLLVTLTFALIYGVIQSFNFDPLKWGNKVDGVILTLGNPNFTAVFLAVPSILILDKILHHRKENQRYFWISLYLVNLYVGYKTLTVQFPFLLLITIIIYLFVANFNKTLGKTKNRAIVLITSIAITLLGVLVFFQKIPKALYQRANIGDRFDSWFTGIEIWRQNPIFGVGVERFGFHSAEFRTSSQIMRNGVSTLPDKSHNLFIDHLANGGVLVGVLWFVFVFMICKRGWELVKSDLEIGERRENAITLAIWMGYLVATLISPESLLMTSVGFISAGQILSKVRDKGSALISDSESIRYGYALRTLYILLLIISFVFPREMLYNAQARTLLNQSTNDWDKAVIAKFDSNEPKLYEELLVKVLTETRECGLIYKWSDELLRLDKRSAQGWYFKALCQDREGSLDQARMSVEKALMFDPRNLVYLDAKVRLEVALGKKSEAQESLGKMIKIAPTYPAILQLETLIEKS
jgi:O-antigen ligase